MEKSQHNLIEICRGVVCLFMSMFATIVVPNMKCYVQSKMLTMLCLAKSVRVVTQDAPSLFSSLKVVEELLQVVQGDVEVVPPVHVVVAIKTSPG